MDVVGGVANPPLVGRTGEREALLDLVYAAEGSRSGVVLVSGTAGVGKTILVRDVCAQVREASELLWAGCLPLSSLVVPFLPLTSAVRDRQAGRAGAPPNFEAGPAGFDGWLDGLCRSRPVVLVVDDLQWADESTLDVLMYVIAGPEERRLAVLGTLRSEEGEVSDALRRWLADVRRLPRVEELVVGPLDRPATGEQLAGLFGGPPRESLVDDVFARTAGNPYLTRLLVRGLPRDAAAVPAGVPRELRDAVARAWYGLSPPAREVTRVIAVAGGPQRADQLAEVLDKAGGLVEALREAVDGGVLEPVTGDSYWFVHPLLAEVLEEGMLPEERRRWHAVFAAAVASGMQTAVGAQPIIDLADHLYRAGDVEPAFHWALRAAAAAERAGGTAESTRLLRRALDLRSHVKEPGVTAIDLLRQIQAAAAGAGLHQDELTAVDELLAVLDRRREPLLAVELLVRRMHLRFLVASEFFAVEPMHEALRLAAVRPGSPQHALAMAELAHAEAWHDVPTALVRAREAVQLARTCGSDRVLTYALVADLIANLMRPEVLDLDEYSTGRAQAEEARQSAIRARDFFGYVHASLFFANSTGWFAAAGVLSFMSRCREELVRLGAPHAYVAWLSGLEADGHLHRGDTRTCRQRLRVALGASPGRRAEIETRLTAALLESWQGRSAEAAGHLERAEELCPDQSGFLVDKFDAVRAELAVASGDVHAAVDAAYAGLGQDTPPTLSERLVPLAARALADEIQRCRDHAADPAPAAARLELLRRRYPQVVPEVYPGGFYRNVVQAMQAWYDAEYARGCNDPGMSPAWAHAADRCRTATLAWDEAYAQWRAAEASIPDRATRMRGVVALRRAYELADALQAAPLLTEITALAKSARVSLAAEPVDLLHVPKLSGLTPREQEIVAFVVAGRTYAEIARVLVISEKTVSSHISNILAKTGTANRVELAQLIRRLSTF